MALIYEGAKEAPLSKLIERCHECDITWGGGNTQLIKYIKPNELNVVYIDVYPDNEYTVDAYNELIDLNKKGIKVLVVPTKCIEEIYILLALKAGACRDEKLIRRCLRWHKWGEEPAPLKGASHMTHEKLCKKVCETLLSDCATITKEKKAQRIRRVAPFIDKDCLCLEAESRCRQEYSATDKAIDVLRQLPVAFSVKKALGCLVGTMGPETVIERVCKAAREINDELSRHYLKNRKEMRLELPRLEYYI